MVSRLDLHETIYSNPLYAELSSEDKEALKYLDLAPFYDEGSFCYYKPREEVEALFLGILDKKTLSYSFSEIVRIARDTAKVCQDLLQKKVLPPSYKRWQRPIAKLTAGPPGSGKTMLVDFLSEIEDPSFLRLNFEALSLSHMQQTYSQDCNMAYENFPREKCKESVEALYVKWLAASQAITHRLLMQVTKLAHQILQKEGKAKEPMPNLSFWCDTSLIGTASVPLLEHLKKAGFFIHLHHLSASEEVLRGSLERPLPQMSVIREKNHLFVQHILDTYLSHADLIFFYHRARILELPVLAACWGKAPKPQGHPLKERENYCDLFGILSIEDQKSYRAIRELHDGALEEMDAPHKAALAWQNSVEAHSSTPSVV